MTRDGKQTEWMLYCGECGRSIPCASGNLPADPRDDWPTCCGGKMIVQFHGAPPDTPAPEPQG